jgi:hypothetical protein
MNEDFVKRSYTSLSNPEHELYWVHNALLAY